RKGYPCRAVPPETRLDRARVRTYQHSLQIVVLALGRSPMAESRKTMGAPPRTAWRAVVISLALHAPLLLLFLPGNRTSHDEQRLDSRVTVSDPFLLRLDPSPSDQTRRVSDIVPVHVERTPANPVLADGGTGPGVDLGAMPGVRGIPPSDGGEGRVRGVPR